MNKSKFLKKSLAALLAIMMVVAMIPLSAAAADDQRGLLLNGDRISVSDGILTQDEPGGEALTDKISYLSERTFETITVAPRAGATVEIVADGQPHTGNAVTLNNISREVPRTVVVTIKNGEEVLNTYTILVTKPSPSANTNVAKATAKLAYREMDTSVSANQDIDKTNPASVYDAEGVVDNEAKTITFYYQWDSNVTKAAGKTNVANELWNLDITLVDAIDERVVDPNDNIDSNAPYNQGDGGVTWNGTWLAQHGRLIHATTPDMTATWPVTAQNGNNTADYKIILAPKPGIESFSVAGVEGVIDDEAGTIKVVLPNEMQPDPKKPENNRALISYTLGTPSKVYVTAADDYVDPNDYDSAVPTTAPTAGPADNNYIEDPELVNNRTVCKDLIMGATITLVDESTIAVVDPVTKVEEYAVRSYTLDISYGAGAVTPPADLSKDTDIAAVSISVDGDLFAASDAGITRTYTGTVVPSYADRSDLRVTVPKELAFNSADVKVTIPEDALGARLYLRGDTVSTTAPTADTTETVPGTTPVVDIKNDTEKGKITFKNIDLQDNNQSTNNNLRNDLYIRVYAEDTTVYKDYQLVATRRTTDAPAVTLKGATLTYMESGKPVEVQGYNVNRVDPERTNANWDNEPGTDTFVGTRGAGGSEVANDFTGTGDLPFAGTVTFGLPTAVYNDVKNGTSTTITVDKFTFNTFENEYVTYSATTFDASKYEPSHVASGIPNTAYFGPLADGTDISPYHNNLLGEHPLTTTRPGADVWLPNAARAVDIPETEPAKVAWKSTDDFKRFYIELIDLGDGTTPTVETGKTLNEFSITTENYATKCSSDPSLATIDEAEKTITFNAPYSMQGSTNLHLATKESKDATVALLAGRNNSGAAEYQIKNLFTAAGELNLTPYTAMPAPSGELDAPGVSDSTVSYAELQKLIDATFNTTLAGPPFTVTGTFTKYYIAVLNKNATTRGTNKIIVNAAGGSSRGMSDWEADEDVTVYSLEDIVELSAKTDKDLLTFENPDEIITSEIVSGVSDKRINLTIREEDLGKEFAVYATATGEIVKFRAGDEPIPVCYFQNDGGIFELPKMKVVLKDEKPILTVRDKEVDTIEVQAEDGSRSSWLVFADIYYPNDDASLKSVTVNETVVEPAEDGTYAIELPEGSTMPAVEDIVVETTAETSTAVVTAGEDGVYTITVTTEKGETTGTYTLTVTVAKNSDNTVASVNVGEVEGVVDNEAKTVAVTLPYGSEAPAASAIVVTAANEAAEVSEVTANEDGTYSFTVTAENGDAVTYTVTVTIEEEPPVETDLTLESVTVGGVAVDLTAENWAVELPYGTELTTDLAVEAVATAGEAVTVVSGVVVNDDATAASVAITVTDVNDETKTATYEIAVTVAGEEPPVLNDDTTLASVTVKGTELTADADGNYAVELPVGSEYPTEEEIVAVATAETSTVVVTPGENGVYTITVTAENGDTADYILTVTIEQEPPVNNPFGDIDPDDDSQWFAKAVINAAAKGYIFGYDDGNFHANDNVTRAQFAAFVARLDGFDKSADYPMNFTDMANVYGDLQKAVGYCVSQGYMNGYGNGKFGPNDTITRQEMAIVLAKVLKLDTKNVTVTDADKFADDAKIADWAYNSVYACKAAGYLKGDGTNFNPTGSTTRGAAAVVLMAMDAAKAQ